MTCGSQGRVVQGKLQLNNIKIYVLKIQRNYNLWPFANCKMQKILKLVFSKQCIIDALILSVPQVHLTELVCIGKHVLDEIIEH